MARATLKRRLWRLEGYLGADEGPAFVLAEVLDFGVPEPGETLTHAGPAADCITFGQQSVERGPHETEAAHLARALAAYREAFPHLSVPVIIIHRATRGESLNTGGISGGASVTPLHR